MTLLSVFEGAADFDNIFTGCGRVPTLGDSGHLDPSLNKSRPPHEPSPMIVMYTIPLPCGTYVYSLKRSQSYPLKGDYHTSACPWLLSVMRCKNVPAGPSSSFIKAFCFFFLPLLLTPAPIRPPYGQYTKITIIKQHNNKHKQSIDKWNAFQNNLLMLLFCAGAIFMF